jgi:hypothetical protein
LGYLGYWDGISYPPNAIIEGLTIYRRPLFDGTYGTDVGNGDEINLIYNSGTGKDPTLVTGSWDVVFALPTNASTGALATGTGNAWSHPHASNLLYTSTTNTGGFMMNGTYTSDGFANVGSPTSVGALATNEKIFSGGYKYTSTSANQGISRSFTATNGGDYVLRALGHSDGTCAPQIKITRADGTTEITHLNGTTTSTRTAPNVYIFTWESPAAESEQVQLINTASSGTCYWHQVEVLANLVDNPSLETGSGDPWIPTGFSNGTEGDPFDSGDTQIETSILHSGISSIRYNAGATSSEWILNTYLGGVGDGYYDRGGYLYGNGTNSPSIQAHYSNREVGQSTGLAQNLGVTTSGWQHKAGVVRHPSGHMHSIRLNGSGQGSVYADDLYTYRLTDVSLTVNPANQANSTEASGLRVDGADTLTQPITGLSATSGVIRYKWTPRYGISIANKFGFPDNSFHRLMIAFGDGSNYVLMNRNTSTQIQAIAYFNGALVTATWNNPVINGGTTYDMEISYQTGGNLIIKQDGVQVASGAMNSASFAVIPTTMWWGSSNGGGYTWDASYTNFVALTPTENTTAPYYKFGSKSAKLVNAGTMPDEYTISINPASTATHTLSAYVYDGTSGNVGGTVSATVAKLVFNGVAVTPASYTDMGGGWWRLTYSAAAVNQAGLYGVQALAGKTIYVDGVQLEAKTYATTYADGSLDTTGKYDWTGTANNSTSTRTISNLQFSNSNTISASAGTVSFWVKSSGGNNIWNDNTGHTLFNVTADNLTRIMKHSGNLIQMYWGGSNLTVDTSSYSKDRWYHILGTWDSSANLAKLYVNNGTPVSGIYSAPTFDTVRVGYLGADATISEVRVFNKALSVGEVANLWGSADKMQT